MKIRNQAAWGVASLVAFVVHAPLAVALLSSQPDAPKPRADAPGPRLPTIDLRDWQPPRLPSPRPPRPLLATRGGGGSRGSRRGEATTARARAIVRLPDRALDETPTARTVVLAEGIAARSDADLAPGGTIGERVGTGTGQGQGPGTGNGQGSGAGHAFEVGEVDVAPRRVSGSEPAYPRLDAMAGREGWVLLRFVVHEDGTVSDVTVQDHQGPSSFLESARSAVLGWHFTAAVRGGQSVACLCVQRLTFQLGGRR